MIEINLIPHELKFKGKKLSIESLTPEYLFYLIPLVLGILICVHIYLAAISLNKNYRLRMLNNRWSKLEPQRKALEGFTKEYEKLLADANVISQLSLGMIRCSEKLNRLSLNLPSGIWFNELTISSRDFILKGSVISLQRQELGLINKFMENLKNDAGFFKDFSNLQLGPLQRRAVGGYEIVDFLLEGSIK